MYILYMDICMHGYLFAFDFAVSLSASCLSSKAIWRRNSFSIEESAIEIIRRHH